MPVRILVADDHEVVLQGIRMILQGRPDWQICGEAKNGAEAISMAQQVRPDIIIMDVTMPVTNGLAAAREIASLGIKAPILIFTMHESKGLVDSVIGVGGRGIVFKSNAVRDLIEALEVLLNGGSYFPSSAQPSTLPKKRDANPGLFRGGLDKAARLV